jgi:type IV pilus assembly protein PilF
MRPVYSRAFVICVAAVSALFLGGCATTEKEPLPTPSPNAESLMNVGDVSLREGKFRQAMRDYMEGDSRDPKNPDLKYRIALVYALYFDRLEDAKVYYQEAIRLRKDFSEAHNGLGAVYLKQEKWDEAIEMCQKAAQNMYYATPELAYINMARAYQGKGDGTKAIEYYKASVAAKPEFLDASLELGVLYQNLAKHDQAVLVFQQARAILEKREPRKANIHDEEWKVYRSSLAEVCYLQGLSLGKLARFSEARTAYQEALSNASSDELQKQIEHELRSLPSP